MSEVGRYRKVYPRIWRHTGFLGLSEGARLVALYVLSGPQMNRIGLSHMSISTGSEDLGTTPQTFGKHLSNVCQTFGWLYDSRARVVFVPSWWTFNRPENENVLKGILNDLSDVPDCALIDAFARNVRTLPETLRTTFVERIRQRLGERPPIQEQEHEQDQEQEQEHEQRAPRGIERKKAIRAVGADPDNKLVSIARETLKLTDPNAPLDDLVDAFRWVAGQVKGHPTFTKDQIVEALNIEFSERRQATA